MRSKLWGSVISRNRQSRIRLPPSVQNNCPVASAGAVDPHRSRRNRSAVVSPAKGHHFDRNRGLHSQLVNELLVVGNDNEPRTDRGDDFSRSSAPPRPLIRFNVPSSISSAPSIVRSRRRSWQTWSIGFRRHVLARAALRCGNGADPEAAAHPADQRLDGVMGRRSSAETDHHSILTIPAAVSAAARFSSSRSIRRVPGPPAID